jgi:hypothetical protein
MTMTAIPTIHVVADILIDGDRIVAIGDATG